MAIDFPLSPALNEFYVYGDKTWQWNGTAWIAYAPASVITGPTGPAGADATPISAIGFGIDGGGAVIATGVAGNGLLIPFACTINAVTLLADQTGSIVVDIWKDTYANYPPTVADSICASAKPTISAALKSEDTTLTGWTKSIAAGDVLRFNVDSVSSIQRLTLVLKVTKT